LRLAIGNECLDVLIAQAGIALIEADRISASRCCEVNELLDVFAAWRRRWVLGEFENDIKYVPDVPSEIHDVFVEGAVVDSEEPQLLVPQGHELREMWRTDTGATRR